MYLPNKRPDAMERIVTEELALKFIDELFYYTLNYEFLPSAKCHKLLRNLIYHYGG